MKQTIEHIAAAFAACPCPASRSELGKLLNRLSAEQFASTGEVYSCGQWVKA